MIHTHGSPFISRKYGATESVNDGTNESKKTKIPLLLTLVTCITSNSLFSPRNSGSERITSPPINIVALQEPASKYVVPAKLHPKAHPLNTTLPSEISLPWPHRLPRRSLSRRDPTKSLMASCSPNWVKLEEIIDEPASPARDTL